MANKENLIKLAQWLLENDEELQAQEKFDLQQFVQDKTEDATFSLIEAYSEGYRGTPIVNHCGTAACALGWAPVALDNVDIIGAPVKVDGSDVFVGRVQCWESYCDVVFDVLFWSRAGQFMFGMHWAWDAVANTPAGTAKRILQYVQEGDACLPEHAISDLTRHAMAEAQEAASNYYLEVYCRDGA